MLGVHNSLGKPTPALSQALVHRTKLPWLGRVAVFLLMAAAAAATAIPHEELTVEDLKARVSAANVGDKAKLCAQIAEKQLSASDKLYAEDDVDKAQTALTDVVTFSELARDYSIQSHKHEKQIEISVRAMTRKLTDMLHTLGHEEQTPVRDAIKRLERVRDDLLVSMFPKGAK
jgi:hypothetical protein